MFYSNRQEFYLKYLATNRPPGMPQTRPMSIGSAFDAYVKSYLVERLKLPNDGSYDLDTIFEKQVDPDNRVWAREHGGYAFKVYEESGALKDLLVELEQASNQPRFEFTVQGKVSLTPDVDGIPLLGKPDLHFITKDGVHVIYDWKVNGYCSNAAISPKPGYIKLRPDNKMHKDCQPMTVSGLTINTGGHFESVDASWADQLAVYAWLLGESVGSKFIVGIEQIVAKPDIIGKKPILRVASHRGRISAAYQNKLYLKILNVWNTILSGHIFNDLTREESDARCKALDEYHKAFDSNDPMDKWFQDITRGHDA
jgi:hypothetical protein